MLPKVLPLTAVTFCLYSLLLSSVIACSSDCKAAVRTTKLPPTPAPAPAPAPAPTPTPTPVPIPTSNGAWQSHPMLSPSPLAICTASLPNTNQGRVTRYRQVCWG
ncbi:hypothetical protein COCMIDRAFT_25687 [Bipolaris oryzae ATCC 44560]|uniref:Uncharacterized protein n=1 Tax=Bipolaris oryzae ATCC 44560 TaxID=930090 RepID=W6Z8F4_COCMI|nr:uncharacterized protein COCMIDRAFT_25687 [Bipolaris oryzae ATCC 44560]EUC46260.1 hypothetical protein COCMIDRAFT_25687 [Bipolaris oryzae ATCC 44560]